MNVDRMLRLLAVTFAIWSFTALVSTAQVGLIAAFVCYLMFGVALFVSQPLVRRGDRFWLIANACAVIGSVAYAYADLGAALVFATVFLQVQKIVRYKTPHDYLWLFALSFFQVVLAAAITIDLTFLIALVAFLFLSVLALALLTLERIRHGALTAASALKGIGRPLDLAFANGNGPSAGGGGKAALDLPAEAVERIKPGALPARYFGTTALVWCIICLVATLFFMAVPRLAVRKVFMQLRPFDPPVVVGFTDQVMVGALGDARRDRTPVMYVWDDTRPGGFQFAHGVLRLRGIALDYFDGLKWYPSKLSNQNRSKQLHDLNSDKRFPFAFDRNAVAKLRIDQEMGQVKWLFGPPFIRDLRAFSELGVSVDFYTDLHAFRVTTPMERRLSYRVQSYLEPSPQLIEDRARQAEQALASGGPIPEDIERWILPDDDRRANTQLPRINRSLSGVPTDPISRRPEIEQAAREITREARTPLDRVRRLGMHFHSRFTYSDAAGPVDVSTHNSLPDFILRSRQGHCEMFAAAMAVMCRMVDVPARVVSGFYTTEFNRYDGFYYVRQSHAHTWVETWIDGYGWMTVDPTPPNALADGGSFLATFDFAREYWDSWTVSWRRYVVDFGLSDQWFVLSRVQHFIKQRLPFLESDWAPKWLRVSLEFNQMSRPGEIEVGPGRLVLLMIAIFAPVAIALIVSRFRDAESGRWRLNLWWRRRRAARCPVDFYAQALAALSRAGFARQAHQTPAEFARAVANEDTALSEFVSLTQAYYRVRFASAPARPDDRRLASRFIAQVKSQRRAGKC